METRSINHSMAIRLCQLLFKIIFTAYAKKEKKNKT